MKIEYKPVGTGAWVVLMDESAGATCERLAYPCRSVNQHDPLASPGGNGSPFLKALGNTSCAFRWAGCIVYATPDLAQAAILALFTALAGSNNHLRVTQSSNILYLPNAQVDAFGAEQQGASVTWDIGFTTGSMTGTALV